MENLELLFADKNPDIVSVVEHWCNSDSVKSMVIPGYIQANYYCRSNRIHGGSMIYVKTGMKMKNLGVSLYSVEMDFEVCGTIVMADNIRFGIISVYRPCSGNFDVFLDSMFYTINYSLKFVDTIFVCGDLNIDFLKKNCQMCKKFVDLLECFGLSVSSQLPTRIFTDINGKTSISKVDYILTNADLSNCAVEVYEAHISDHRVLSLELCTNFNISTISSSKFVRNMSKHNLSNFVDCIRKESFQDIYNYTCVDQCFEAFIAIIQNIFETCCPLRKINFEPSHNKNWVTPEIISAKRDLQNIHWLHSNIRSESSYELYKKAKLSYGSLIKNTKLNFNSQIIDKSDNKNRTLWNMVNTLTGRNQRTTEPSELIIDEISHGDVEELVELFAGHFSSVTEATLKRYYDDSLSFSCTTSRMVNSNFYFYPVIKHEVVDIITSLKNKSSAGLDSVSARVLKMIGEDIAQHFAYCINLSVTTGIFPSPLKKAIVIPLHKSNDVKDITNYRPISLLSVFSKVFERIVFNRMMCYLNKFGILDNAQHGFRSGRSTQSGAIHFVEFVYERLDKGLSVSGLFFDLSRAFDSLSFQFILDKCYNLGFRGVILDWLRSYLEGRLMTVKIQNTFSSYHDIKLGVPQGSVLGPLLFLLFINDLPDNLMNILAGRNLLTPIDNFKVTLFADDTSVAVTAPSFEELQSSCELLVRSFVDWCRENALMININKTVCIHFTSGIENRKLVFGYRDTTIISKDCTKFLGIHIDRNLKWSTHVDLLCRKLNNSYYAISRIRNTVPMSTLLNVYYSLVYSHLSYNILLWGNSTDVSRVFILQKRILRLIFNIPLRSSCRPLFLNHGVLTLPSIFILRCLVYVKENELHFSRLSVFHSYNTRNDRTLFVPKHKTTKFEKSPFYQCVKLFNHLPKCIQSLTVKKFKTVVKAILLKNVYYSLGEYYSDNNLEIFLY